MGESHLNRRATIVSGLMGLLLIGLDAAAAIVAINRNTPLVLIPFVIATLISCGAIWWAHRPNDELAASPPFCAGKFTPDSSHTYPANSVDWKHPARLGDPSFEKGLTMR